MSGAGTVEYTENGYFVRYTPEEVQRNKLNQKINKRYTANNTYNSSISHLSDCLRKINKEEARLSRLEEVQKSRFKSFLKGMGMVTGAGLTVLIMLVTEVALNIIILPLNILTFMSPVWLYCPIGVPDCLIKGVKVGAILVSNSCKDTDEVNQKVREGIKQINEICPDLKELTSNVKKIEKNCNSIARDLKAIEDLGFSTKNRTPRATDWEYTRLVNSIEEKLIKNREKMKRLGIQQASGVED